MYSSAEYCPDLTGEVTYEKCQSTVELRLFRSGGISATLVQMPKSASKHSSFKTVLGNKYHTNALIITVRIPIAKTILMQHLEIISLYADEEKGYNIIAMELGRSSCIL